MKNVRFLFCIEDLIKSLLLLLILGSFGCSEEEDPNNVTNPNIPVMTKLEITETSPEIVFWGEEVTITGMGFSSKLEDNFVWLKNETASLSSCPSDNRNDSTGWRKATVLKATPTSLTIKIPYKTAAQNGGKRACGVVDPSISISANGKTVVSKKIKLLGIPYISSICYTNSGFQGSGIIPGKELENQISIPGIGVYGSSSGIDNKVKLLVNGAVIPLTKIESTGPTNCASGYKFIIPIEFSTGICTPDPIRPGRFSTMMDFVAFIEGTTIKSEIFSYPVRTFPEESIESFAAQRASKGAGGNPEIKIKGKGLNWYKEARFISTNSAGCPMTTIGPVSNVAGTELTVGIPLANMTAGCTYQISLINTCGISTGQIGQVIIDP
ncbi:hypothetical protein M3O96_07115 [Aquiflexum sp. TKW24L]|uniref:hypothetical protein n=1 Tax=Aquiflexum sp. TKW24L TaxID=2942212 RepID=UPI0020C0F1DC|nr:hypothetical protein [Aquiflexum sp. TKW24L]MCL6258848.1 hypothetical protein [Aquiflexum sp. TKW24L]